MKRIALFSGLCFLLFVACAPCQEQLHVLIVNGQNNHDFESTTASLKETLGACGRFRVDVSTTPAQKAPEEEWAAWRPDFSAYRAVLLDYNGQRWPAPVEKAFLEYAKGGGGVVLVHAANNSFTGWKEFERMAGLLWRNADYGARLVIDDKTRKAKRVKKGEGPGAGHGRQHAFVVKVRKPEHPIMRGIPRQWFHAKDELYHGQRGPARNMTVLSSAYSDPETGGTGEHEPITWVVPFGQGRVVTTVLGHHWRGQKDFDALHCVGFQAIAARALEWAASGVVTLGVPEAFPSKKKSSIVTPGKVNWPPIEEKPSVLLLGDSISMGYTRFVRETLAGEARVWRAMNVAGMAENCAGTTKGVAQIDRWLRMGGGQWDVIHFNFGLHDLKRVHPETGKNSNDPGHPHQASSEQYEKQLREIVAKLQKTGARLIFATTTPVPPGGVKPYRDVEDPARYNAIAVAVMREAGIEVNDLYAFALERLGEIQQPVNVHFTRAGSEALGTRVVASVRSSLAISKK